MKIVLGLGNPGERYRGTRHNVGHEVVELLAKRWAQGSGPETQLGNAALTMTVCIRGHDAVLSRSRTYMNRSGRAAVALRDHYGIEPRDLLAVYDDADLELGRIRIRERGGSGGHNGMQSLVDALGSVDMPRIRLGVLGRERESGDLADYVLSPFELDEEGVARTLIELGADAVETAVSEGIGAAMNRFNSRTVGEGTGNNE